jgi:hypothetical protein
MVEELWKGGREERRKRESREVWEAKVQVGGCVGGK